MSPVLARRAGTAALSAALVLGLSACGTGFRAQTYEERTQADATNEAIGNLDIRNLRILPPEGAGSQTYEVGEDVQARATIVNQAPEDDRLVSVTSPAAASVDVVGLDGRERELVVPGQSMVEDFAFVLRGLTQELRTGEYVEMELTFERGGTEAMLVPVELTGIPGEQVEDYEVVHTDSNGDPLVEHGEGEHEEGEQGSEQGPQGGITGEGTAGSGQADTQGEH